MGDTVCVKCKRPISEHDLWDAEGRQGNICPGKWRWNDSPSSIAIMEELMPGWKFVSMETLADGRRQFNFVRKGKRHGRH